MVKSPRIRHSKSPGEPVTIELGKDDVSRIAPDSAKPESKRDEARSATTNSSVGDAPAPHASPDGPKAKPETAAPSSASASSARGDSASTSSSSASSAGSKPADAARPSAFGRDAGKQSPPEAPAPKAAPSSAAPRSEPRRGGTSALVAGLLGGIIALAGVGGAYYAGLLPSANTPAVSDSAPLDALQADLAALRTEIEALRADPAPAAADNSAIEARIEAMGVLVDELRAQLAAIDQPGDGGSSEAVTALQTRLEAVEQAVAGAGSAASPDVEAIRAEIAQLARSGETTSADVAAAVEAAQAAAGRIDALEQQLAALSGQLAEQAERPGVALAIAASALKAAIDRGTPFMTELETYASVAPDSPEIAALRDMAASGVPTNAAIEAEANDAAIAMIGAGRAANPQAGLFDRLLSSAQSLVTVRPIGNVAGADVPATVARLEAALRNGDHAAALAEYETLPEAAKTAGADFIAKIRARQAADQIIGKALADALRA